MDIRIDGDRPWDIQVHNEEFYARALNQGTLGLGESYVDGWWDAEELDGFFFKLIRNDPGESIRKNWRTQATLVSQFVLNRQRWSKRYEVGEKHYDTGNDLFQIMLDKRMAYSCAYWKGAETLDEAQEAKLDLVCRKLQLEPGMKVLDIGCGWGSFSKFAAEKYGVSVVGINNSKEQAALGRELSQGLPVEIRLQDYREVTGTYDRVVSIGMFEHVGPKNYRTYMEVVDRCMADDGIFLLHTLGSNKFLRTPDLFTEKYIFPGGVLPTIRQISGSIEGLFTMEDWHNIGSHYDRTLLSWYENFNAGWEQLRPKYGDRFYRMWKYFLHTFAGASRARSNQVWQIAMMKKGMLGGYESVR